MVQQISWSRRSFIIFNYIFFTLLAFTCLVPLIHVLAVSFSSSAAASAGLVKLWPVQGTLKSYSFVLQKPEFFTAILISCQRVLLGTTINMLLTILIAYPLSKESKAFPWRTFYAWFFVITILFQPGLIPNYMTIRATGLLDTLWALVIPKAVPVFNVLLLLNFFRGLPKELEEAAFMDGAGFWRTLWTIYVPLSAPALATICLFAMVNHWNSWFDGLILMNSPAHYPLQSYLQTVITAVNSSSLGDLDPEEMELISDRTTRAAQVFLGALPILLVYPFLQKFFMKGIVLGSVKE
jgi:putative aldouronate transport system permease protein